MREMSSGISKETVEAADELMVLVLSMVDAAATGARSVQDILAEAIAQADVYRTSRVRDAFDAVAARGF